MTVIDGESIISRVYKKCNGKIDSDVLTVIMLYNKHIVDEQYEGSRKIKNTNSYRILNKCKKFK